MRPTVTQYAQALHELSSKGEAKQIASNFLGFLTRRGEGKKAKAVLKALEHMERKEKGELHIRVTTAHEANKEMKESLSEKAAKLFPGKKLSLVYDVDEAILGGARIETEEIRYDATLASELASLKKAITKA